MPIYAISKLERVTVILKGDDALGPAADFAAYQCDRDESHLDLLGEPTRFIVRPLTAAEERNINVSALRNSGGDVNSAGVEIRTETVKAGLIEVRNIMQDGVLYAQMDGPAAMSIMHLQTIMELGGEIAEIGTPTKKAVGTDEGK